MTALGAVIHSDSIFSVEILGLSQWYSLFACAWRGQCEGKVRLERGNLHAILQ